MTDAPFHATFSTSFNATFFDGHSSQSHDVYVNVDAKGYWHVTPLTDDSSIQNLPKPETLNSLRISRRLGNTPRRVTYSGGAMLIIDDNALVDTLITRYGKPSFLNRIIHLLESRLRYVALLAIIAVALIGFLKLVVLPTAATHIAHTMPQKMITKIGEQSFSDIESFLFEPSTLSERTQTRIRNHFKPFIDQFDDLKLTVAFRDSHIGPNALAFPHGLIVFTDDLVNLAEHDDELLSIFAHEIGHIYHRHSMQNVVHHSSINFLITMTFGGAGNGLAGGVTDMVLNGGYSRNLETEADDFSYHYAEHELFDPIHFSNIMQRMVESAGVDCERVDFHVDCGSDAGNTLEGFLSTHPVSEARIQRFLDLHVEQLWPDQHVGH